MKKVKPIDEQNDEERCIDMERVGERQREEKGHERHRGRA